MSKSTAAAAPVSGSSEPLHPDPEIAALLDFEPAPRRVKRPDGWTPERQRRFIALIVETGSPQRAALAMKKVLSGVEGVYRSDGADGFRAAWDGAVALAEARERQALTGRTAETIADPPRPGQLLNEYREWEDEDSLRNRASGARDNISEKLLRARRLYLAEISTNAGKRAAFEILTDLPIDWAKAERLEEQPDEPFRKPNLRKPDMLLTAENGWMGDYVHGPDKVGELRAAVDAYRMEQGMEAVGWEE